MNWIISIQVNKFTYYLGREGKIEGLRDNAARFLTEQWAYEALLKKKVNGCSLPLYVMPCSTKE